MVKTPRTRGLELARQLQAMSPEAQRLLAESSRWWPLEDGGVAFRIDADKQDLDALRELSDALSSGLDLEVQHLRPDEVVACPDGDGLSFSELRQTRRERAQADRL